MYNSSALDNVTKYSLRRGFDRSIGFRSVVICGLGSFVICMREFVCSLIDGCGCKQADHANYGQDECGFSWIQSFYDLIDERLKQVGLQLTAPSCNQAALAVASP